MSDFEDRLRAALRSEADGIGATPLRRDASRRIRTRRLFMATAAVAVAVIVAGGGAVLVSSTTDPAPEVAGEDTQEPERNESGSGGTYPCKHAGLEGECVAHGEYDGVRWWIGARVKGGDLCISDVQADVNGFTGGGSGCGPYQEGEIGYGVTFGAESPLGMAQGEVSADADRLVLERDEGSPIELELYPAPEGFPLDIEFYNVFLPEDPVALVAYDASGNEIARREIDGPTSQMLDMGPEPPKTLLESGDFEGDPWTMYVYDEQGNGQVAPCAEVFLGEDEMFGGGGGCYDRVPGERVIGFSETSFESRPGVLAVLGAVDSRATRVIVELDSGETHEADVYEHPAAGRDDVSFFAVWISDFDPSVSGELVVLDHEGNELARIDLCDNVAVGSTCG